MHNFKVKLLQPCLHLYTTPLVIILESYGSHKKACKFCRDKNFDFPKGTPMTCNFLTYKIRKAPQGGSGHPKDDK